MNIIQKFKSLDLVSKCAIIFFGTVATIYGGSKHTNNVPPILGLGLGPRSTEESNFLCPPPPLLSTLTNWHARGAWCDWTHLTLPSSFRFPLGTNYLTELTLMSYGEIRSSLRGQVLTTLNQQPPTTNQQPTLALAPNVTTVSYGPTPSNTFLIAWQDAFVNRDPTNRTDAAIELFESGEIVTSLGNTVGRVPPRPPQDFIGSGQDDAWLAATFPADIADIRAIGYSSWLDGWVGVDEQNGRYQAAVTIAALPTNGAPCYLVCGPFRVNVTAPGTYRFPLEVFEVYETRTYPEAVPLSVAYDDGYTGLEESFEMVDVPEDPPLPRLMMAMPLPYTSPLTSTVIRNYMQPKVIVTPNRVPLESAEGTHLNIWCNMSNISDWFYRASRELYLNFCFPTDAEIIEADVENLVEIILENRKGGSHGGFTIYRSTTNETNVVVRTDATVFAGGEWQSELTNDTRIIRLTAVTAGGSTSENLVTASVQYLEGQSVYVGVFMATSEHPGEPNMPYYGDSVGWSVLSSGVSIMEGTSNASVWTPGGYSCGGLSDAVFLGGQRIDPSTDGRLHLRLIATAKNETDGLRQTAIQLVVYPIDSAGNIIGLPWSSQ